MADPQHIFVVVLENRSFDHMFALSAIPGIRGATSANSNNYLNVSYPFGDAAPERMPSDPLHGFCDVFKQLCGANEDCANSNPYPARDNSGFVANYATTKVRSGGRKQPLPPMDFGKIMSGVDTPRQATALYTLATEFALCDAWHASLPGPTWPNRFFLHGASSAGMADAPRAADIFKWEVRDGFEYPNGSLFDRLGRTQYRLYQDKSGPWSGRIPQVAALKGISFFDIHDLGRFASDLEQGYDARYTFIEPAYGDVVSDTYVGGSSQHPMDGLAAGDRLIARVYNAIRQSPLWENALLIVTYDEHGGFYDSIVPGDAVPPGDQDGGVRNHPDFDFSVYGPRVPAVVVSPWVARGGVDHTPYDHASIPATVERLFGIDPMTDRDRGAADVRHLVTDTFRPDCPETIAVTPLPRADANVEAAPDEEPVEDGSNLQAFLYVARKADRERVGDLAALSRFQTVQTRGDARRYLEEIMPELEAMQAAGLRA